MTNPAPIQDLDGWCGNCQLDPVWNAGRCVACWKFRKRKGYERPEILWERHYDRRYEKLAISGRI